MSYFCTVTADQLFIHIIDFERGTFIMFCICWAYYFFTNTGNKPWRVDKRMCCLYGGLMLWKLAVLLLRTVSWFPQLAGNPHLDLLSFQLDIVTVVWVVLGLTGLSRRRRLTWWLWGLHLVPISVLIVLNFCCLDRWVWWASWGYSVLYGLVFLVLCGRAAWRYNNYVHEIYAAYSRNQLIHSAWVMILMIVQFSLWSASMWIPTLSCGAVYYLTSLILWTFANLHVEAGLEEREASNVDMNSFVLSMDELEKQQDADFESDSAAQETSGEDTDESMEVFAYRLRTICEETKLYAQEGITRDDMAKAMHINHTYFSQMLRQTTGKTFYEYVNSLRMDDAQRLLSDPDFPLDMVPLEIGYRHKSTYYRVFQERFGCKPQEWRERHLASATR